MRVKSLTQEHNVVPLPGREPEALDPKSSTQTIIITITIIYTIELEKITKKKEFMRLRHMKDANFRDENAIKQS